MTDLTVNYREYLRSPAWDKKRRKRLMIDGYACVRCGRKSRELHVHHKTYERLGRERMEDLETLCKRCHKREHGLLWRQQIASVIEEIIWLIR